jgi:hypothetical protein
VRAPRSTWSTTSSPVLTCGYAELSPKHQVGGASVVSIEFHEYQRFTLGSGWTFVKGLGSCAGGPFCPAPNKPAWVQTTIGYTPGPNSYAYDSQVVLRVKDGLNAIQITVADPSAPIAGNPIAQAEAIARSLLPRFLFK